MRHPSSRKSMPKVCASIAISGLIISSMMPVAMSQSPDMATQDAAPSATLDAQLAQAESLLESGDRQAAANLLAPIVGKKNSAIAPRQELVANALLGRASLQLGEMDTAEPLLRKSAALAATSGDLALVAAAQNDLGLYLTITRDDDGAFAAFARARAAADVVLPNPMSVRIEINLCDLHLRRGETRLAQQALARGATSLKVLPVSIEKERLASAFAARTIRIADHAPWEADFSMASVIVASAAVDAQRLGDLRGLSSVLGETGRIEDRIREPLKALADVQRAIFVAQVAQAPDLLYRWQWDKGRLERAGGQTDEALGDYRDAIATLEPIRHDVMLELRGSGRSYREEIGPLFQDEADLLLRQAETLQTDRRQENLRHASEAIEQLKTVELEDYFKDDCSAELRAVNKGTTDIPDGTAVIYPVILPDRLELLVSIGGRIEQYQIAVAGKALSDEALRLRKLLVKPDSTRYLDSAQKLYGWLIRPLESLLSSSRVDTLVIVPDGALLGVPFAALHDGQGFLIQKYAVATAPGLRWVDLKKSRSVSSQALVGGLSDAVQGFSALPGVDIELKEVASLYGGTLLDNSSFTELNVEQALSHKHFSLVHIASHAMFASEASKSFVLTYDGRIGMDALERVIGSGASNENTVDLLTLSACETAAGDERAALGLAGVAIKAGARSVVATLWNIDDGAASDFIREFYWQLNQNEGLSKAKALQAAELHLLADTRYQHPGFWAPFLIIGDWT